MPTGASVEIIGRSLDDLKEYIVDLAENNCSILLIGAVGTGKEQFANLYASKNKKSKIFPINCAGVADSLLQTELFGHVKGAFTGAVKARDGVVKGNYEEAILFLDEIGDATEALQASLLRLLQSGDYKPVGSDTIINIDKNKLVVIAATSKPEKLRRDLKDRFMKIVIPVLTDRDDDAGGCDIHEFLQKEGNERKVKYISGKALDAIHGYSWPGNIRELLTVIEAADMLRRKRKDDTIRAGDLPLHFGVFPINLQDISPKIAIKLLPAVSHPKPIMFFLVGNEKTNAFPEEAYEHYSSEYHGFKENQEDLFKQNLITAISRIGDSLFGAVNLGQGSPEGQLEIPEWCYENTDPDRYKEQFWEHHARSQVKPQDVKKRFPLLDDSKISRLLGEARKRLKQKQQSIDDKNSKTRNKS